MADEKNKKKQADRQENWPGAVKAIGLEAVKRGQLISFGLILIGAILASRLNSEGVVRVLELLLSSKAFAVVGWGLFILTAFGLTFVIKAQRSMYLKEIDRLSNERNRLQGSACERIIPSGYEAKP